MAGETLKTEAICLAIHPWSRTSHVVVWLTPEGRVSTVVKGAVRPKSVFLGQYDLNYTCEIVYYASAKGDLHALREAVPVNRRDELREDFRALVFVEYARLLVAELAPGGDEAREWFELMSATLDAVARDGVSLGRMLKFELDLLRLAGLSPSFDSGALTLRGERSIPVSSEVFTALNDPLAEKNLKILVDAARVIGVFYSFHVDIAVETRRSVLNLILN